MYLILQDHTGYSSKVASPSCILFVCLVVFLLTRQIRIAALRWDTFLYIKTFRPSF